jgi:hypothetical protein
MAIGNRQIGWSQEENLLWEISKQLDKMNSILCTGPCPTTTSTTTATLTTTTTTTTEVLINTNYTFINCIAPCGGGCRRPLSYYDVWMTETCIDSWMALSQPTIGCEVWLDSEGTIPFPSGNYNNDDINCIEIIDGVVTNIV